MIKRLLQSIFVLLLLFCSPFAAHAFGVSPAHIELFDIHRSTHIERAAHLSSGQALSEDAQLIVSVSGDGKDAVTTPLGTSVLWPAHQKKLDYPFGIIGQNLPNGTYEVIISFALAPQSQSSESVRVLEGVGMRVAFSITDQTIDGLQELQQISIGAKQANDTLELSLLGVNSTNIPLQAETLVASVTAEDGSTRTFSFSPAAGIVIPPFSQLTLRPVFENPIEAGAFTAVISLLDDQKQALLKSKSVAFSVAPAPTWRDKASKHKVLLTLIILLSAGLAFKQISLFSKDVSQKK